MKKEKLSEQFEFLGTNYAVTKHLDAELIEIAEYVGIVLGKSKYKTIYFGHIDPLREAIKFFDNFDGGIEKETK